MREEERVREVEVEKKMSKRRGLLIACNDRTVALGRRGFKREQKGRGGRREGSYRRE